MLDPFGGMMRKLILATLYTAFALGANLAVAQNKDLDQYATGAMKKLVFSEATEVSDIPVTAEDGSQVRLADYKGNVVLVNFWATWCAPCRKEMPALAELQEAFEDAPFEVVTIATARSVRPKVDKFLDEIGVSNLPRLIDENMALARASAVMALPVSVILNEEGNEIARLKGDAEWASDEAKALIQALIDNAN
jgi:thiol-disulfide isomerase/thioredoxin